MTSQSEVEQLQVRRADLLIEIGKVDAALAALAPVPPEPAVEVAVEPEPVTEETPVTAPAKKPKGKRA